MNRAVLGRGDMRQQDVEPMEGLFVAGVNFRTAPVAVREQLAVAHPHRAQVSRELLETAGLSELVLLWTCNRVEIYGVAERLNGNIHSLFHCLSTQPLGLESQVYHYYGEEAARHLFRVVSGLDSMVLGETEITGQVKAAYQAALEARLTGKVLNHAFQKSFQTAKEIRTRTSIGHGCTSVGGVAVAHAERIFRGDLAAQTVLVIGAGAMAKSCLRHLNKKGIESIIVANRSLERAQGLAAEFGGRAVPFDGWREAAAEADIVVSSTGSPDLIIGPKDVEELMQRRPERRVVMIDIAVPRDIDPAVGRIPGVHLYDIDGLESTVRQTLSHRSDEVALCREIIERKVAVWARRMATRPEEVCLAS